MKRINCIHYIVACMLLMCITACDKENSTIEDEIPAAIKSDFSKRYPSAEITSFMNYDSWKMTYTAISDIQQLPIEVQTAFLQAGYIGVQDIEIFKTERAGITRPLYTLHFTYPWKKSDNMQHYIYINDDGLYLRTLRCTPNDTRWFVNLPEDHFNFIHEKYKGAEIRGYMNDGEHESIQTFTISNLKKETHIFSRIKNGMTN